MSTQMIYNSYDKKNQNFVLPELPRASTKFKKIIARPCEPSDSVEVCKLVNSCYRGEFSRTGWTSESDLLDGQRIDSAMLGEILSQKEKMLYLFFNDTSPKELLGSVLLSVEQGLAYIGSQGLANDKEKKLGHIGMLTVRPDLQNSGLGRAILNFSESWIDKVFGLDEAELEVISCRSELIAWYQRRGYVLTAERRPFPYGDSRFGLPKTSSLEFVVLRKTLAD